MIISKYVSKIHFIYINSKTERPGGAADSYMVELNTFLWLRRLSCYGHKQLEKTVIRY